MTKVTLAITPLTVHLPFVGEDDLSSATRRVDRQRLVEGLLDLRSPDTFSREVKKERIAETCNVQVVDEMCRMIMLD